MLLAVGVVTTGGTLFATAENDIFSIFYKTSVQSSISCENTQLSLLEKMIYVIMYSEIQCFTFRMGANLLYDPKTYWLWKLVSTKSWVQDRPVRYSISIRDTYRPDEESVHAFPGVQRYHQLSMTAFAPEISAVLLNQEVGNWYYICKSEV